MNCVFSGVCGTDYGTDSGLTVNAVGTDVKSGGISSDGVDGESTAKANTGDDWYWRSGIDGVEISKCGSGGYVYMYDTVVSSC